MRPYADRMQELMVGTSRAASSFRNLALMQRREVSRVAVLVVTGDRGLAGPFNGQVLRRAFELERTERGEGHDIAWLVAGRKGASTLRFRRYELDGAAGRASPTSRRTPTRRRSRTSSPSCTRPRRSTASCSSTTATCRRSCSG